MDQINKILKIISISPDERSIEDVNQLIQLTKDIQFFKYYIEQNKSEIHKQCCRWVVLETHQYRNVVFNIGTIGEVGVYIRNKRGAPNEEQEKLMRKKPKNKFQKITRLLKDNNYKLETESSLIKEANTLSNVIEKVFKKQVHNFRQQTLHFNRFNSLDSEFVCVSTLKQGSSFGELALINDRPRLATIVCNTNCKFAVLDKEHFQRILKEQEEIKLMKALALYSSIPLFETFSTYLLKQVHWHSFRVKYKMNEKVFAQGDEVDALYIVYSGEFLVYQKFDQSIKTEQEEEESDNLNEEQFFSHQRVKPKMKQKPLSSGCNYVEGTDIRICLLLPYQLLGEDDIFEGTNRSYNVVCASAEGELIRIKSKDFKQKIMNDEGARQYLEKNVPLKRKLMQDKILHKKNTLLSNISYLTQKKQTQSLQSKLQNGQINDATFLSQKLLIPSSQIMKQNFVQSVTQLNQKQIQNNTTQNNTNHEYSKNINSLNNQSTILKDEIYPNKDQSQTQLKSSFLQNKSQLQLNSKNDILKSQILLNSMTILDQDHNDKKKIISFKDSPQTKNELKEQKTKEDQQISVDIESQMTKSKELLKNKRISLQIPKRDIVQLQSNTNKQFSKLINNNQSSQLNTINQNTTNNTNNNNEEVKIKEHETLKEYFLKVGDPLLRGCFIDELNKNKQTSNHQIVKNDEQLNSIFKSRNQNPSNHQYHPSSKSYNQPQKEDYVHVNGNIRQVLKYRGPLENNPDLTQSHNLQEGTTPSPQKSCRTIAFFPNESIQSSPKLASRKAKGRYKTMQDLGPGELFPQVEEPPKGIREVQMNKMQGIIRLLNTPQKQRSQSQRHIITTTKPIKISGTQSSIIKHKGITVSSYSNISHMPFNSSQVNLSQHIHQNHQFNEDAIHKIQSKKRISQNIPISQSIMSLQEIGSLSPRRDNQSKQRGGNNSPEQINTSQKNLFTSYGLETEACTTERSKNSRYSNLIIFPKSAKDAVSRRQTDRVQTQQQKLRSSQQEINIDNQEQSVTDNNFLTFYSVRNQTAHKSIQEGTKILKELIQSGHSQSGLLSNKNYKGRQVVENNSTSKLNSKSFNKPLFNQQISPNKIHDNSNKKILFSFTNLNNVKSKNEIATQTEIEKEESHPFDNIQKN